MKIMPAIQDKWSGLIIDRSEKRISAIRKSEIYWQHDLSARALFLDRNNADRAIAMTFRLRGMPVFNVITVQLEDF